MHDGVHNYGNRQKYKYIGGTHGYSKKLLTKFPHILDYINCDEGKNEYIVTLLIEQYPDLNINSMKTKNCFSVQYHPEAGPGPNDATYLFDVFKENIAKQ